MYTLPTLRLHLALLLAIGFATAPAVVAEERAPLDLPESLRSVAEGDRIDRLEQLKELQAQVRRVVELSRPRTVAIEVDDSVGSGVVISPEGLVLTAAHVCTLPNRRVTLRFPDNREAEGLSLGVDHRFDSGLVRITSPPPTDPETGESGWPFLPLVDREIEAGEWVVGLGQPNGFIADRQPPVRLGRVLVATPGAINTDVALVGGDSGGPLLTLRGEVAAIHSKIGERVTSNYHVPVGAFQRYWNKLVAGKMEGVPEGEDPADYRPIAGIAVRRVGERLVVTQVFPELPADQAGVEVGDVVASLAGEPVGTPAEVDRVVRRQKPFDRVPLKVLRAGDELELELWLSRASVGFPGSTVAQGGGR